MRRWWLPLFLLFCALCSIGLLIYPLTIIQPFKYQAAGDLMKALSVFRWAPALTAGIAIGALVSFYRAWGTARHGPRIVSVLLMILICGSAVLTRVNVFEQMFHPAGTPQFVAVKNARIEPGDMLVTVALNGDAHAYPIREMGYHHVVNDFVGGVPIVATY